MADSIKKSDFIQSLDKGLKVISAFDAHNTRMTLTEVARQVGITRANARRILLTLEYLGYVHSEDGKYFKLSPKILSLGYSYLSALPFRELANPYLNELAQIVEESCSISVLDGTDIVYVSRVQTSRIMTIALGIGTRLPVYATSMGRVLLAGLEEDALLRIIDQVAFNPLTSYTITDKTTFLERVRLVRQRGWALADQELEIGVRSIAGPIKDKTGKTVAAMNISGHASRVSREEMIERFLPELKKVLAKIEHVLYKL